MDGEQRQSIKDALEFARRFECKGQFLIDFAAYIIRRDGVMSKEKSERLVRKYMKQEG